MIVLVACFLDLFLNQGRDSAADRIFLLVYMYQGFEFLVDSIQVFRSAKMIRLWPLVFSCFFLYLKIAVCCDGFTSWGLLRSRVFLMQCVTFCYLLWLFNPACYLDVVALRTTLVFFSCLIIRDPHITLIFTHGTIITQHVGKLCNLESVIIL